MKKYFIFLFLPIMLYGYAQYSDGYPMVKLKEYLKGAAKNQIGLLGDMGDGYSGYYGPTGISFSPKGLLVINDTWNTRIVVYDDNFLELDNTPYSEQIQNPVIVKRWKNEYSIFFYLSNKMLIIDSINGKLKSCIDLQSKTESEPFLFFRYSNGWLINGNNRLFSISSPGPDPEENNGRILDEKATCVLFDEPEKYGLTGVTLDGKNRLFVNGELETRDYLTFSQYWNEKYEKYPLHKDHKFPVYSEKTAPYIQFVGKDVDGNVYWCINDNKIQVYNNKGIVIDLFKYDREKSQTLPVVHPSGDVYFLDYDKNGVYLYRTENVWDKGGRSFWYETNATVTASNVRLRRKPSLNGAEAGFLQTDERIIILETTKELTRVGDKNAPWHRLRTKSGLEAWAYGGFIEKDEE